MPIDIAVPGPSRASVDEVERSPVRRMNGEYLPMRGRSRVMATDEEVPGPSRAAVDEAVDGVQQIPSGNIPDNDIDVREEVGRDEGKRQNIHRKRSRSARRSGEGNIAVEERKSETEEQSQVLPIDPAVPGPSRAAVDEAADGVPERVSDTVNEREQRNEESSSMGERSRNLGPTFSSPRPDDRVQVRRKDPHFFKRYVRSLMDDIKKQESERAIKFLKDSRLSSVGDERDEELLEKAKEEFITIDKVIGLHSTPLWLLLKKIMPNGRGLELPPDVMNNLPSWSAEELEEAFFKLLRKEYNHILPPSGTEKLYENLQSVHDKKNFDELQSSEGDYCKPCVSYNCQKHGPETMDKKRFDPIRRCDSGAKCCNDCYQNYGIKNGEFIAPTLEDLKNIRTIPIEEKDDMRIFYKYLTNKDFKICDSIKDLGELGGKRRSCAEMYKLSLLREEEIKDHVMEMEMKEVEVLDEKAEIKRIKRQINRLKNMKRLNLEEKDEESGIIQIKKVVPCNHEGTCEEAGAQCSCYTGGYTCSSFCKCGVKCSILFPGCRCKKVSKDRQCSENNCVCLQNTRECDPELCGCCPGARDEECRDIINGLVDVDLKKEKLAQCVNTAAQRKVTCKMMVGRSLIPNSGRGCFLGEKLKLNQFIGEYTGEIIDEEENTRRSALYQDRMSYSFGINKEQLIDSTFFGNMLRFMNNGPEKKVNVFCRNTIVNGEQRMKVYAGSKLPEGTELLMNYRYKKEDEEQHFNNSE